MPPTAKKMAHNSEACTTLNLRLPAIEKNAELAENAARHVPPKLRKATALPEEKTYLHGLSHH